MKKLIILLTLSFQLFALEIDQFSDRDRYQDDTFDFTEILNLYTNDFIEKAIHQFHRKYRHKKLNQREIHRYMAFEIFKVVAGGKHVQYGSIIPDKLNIFYALTKSGTGPVQKWIESEFNDLYWNEPDHNIYDGIIPDAFNRNYVIQVGGVFMGPDKIDHFLDQGYSYWVKSNFGEDDEAAKEFGAYSEYGWYGFKSGGVFSFGDLRANWGGYQFYKNLFVGEKSHLLVDSKGRVSVRRQFDWGEHVDWHFDELLNPSMFKEKFYKKIMINIKSHLARSCETYAFLDEKGFFRQFKKRESFFLAQGLPTLTSHPFDIKALCSE